MQGGFAPRFALEAGFLILVGVAAGYADLRTPVIVALLAGGWIVVSLVELAVWRSQSRHAVVPVPPPAPVEEEPAPEAADEEPVEVEDTEYPLRAGAGDLPSGEVEEYTRVLGATEGDSPAEAAQ